MYEQLRDLRSDKDKEGIIKSVTDAVEILSAEISGVPTEVTVLDDLRALPAETKKEDF